MDRLVKLMDVVALTADQADGLARGQVGTVVDELSPDVVEVEFSDSDGRAYAQCAIRKEHLLVLHYRPERAA